MGYFPDCIRLRLVENARPPGFEVAEILDLQVYREAGAGENGLQLTKISSFDIYLLQDIEAK